MKCLAFFLILTLTAICVDSCTTDRRAEVVGGIPAAKPPSFLNGPLAVLLTNTGGFSAQVVMETRSASNPAEIVSGELLGRGTKLLFAPETRTPARKRSNAGGISFIWDVAANRGFLLSEALQAYAPVTVNVQPANLVLRAGMEKSAPQKVDGHPCEQQEAIVTSGDGSVAAFLVWRAADLKGLPVRINSTNNAMSITLNLSKIQPTAPSNELFSPPDGFTKYDNADAMMNELAARQQGVRRNTIPFRSRPEDEPEPVGVGGRTGQGYGGRQ